MLTLTEFNSILKNKLPNIIYHIKGEVSRPKLYDSGLYFTLKDDNIMMNCKMWKSNITSDIINIKNGDNIVFLSSVNDKNPLSNKRSNVGVNMKPLKGSIFSISFDATQGLI